MTIVEPAEAIEIWRRVQAQGNVGGDRPVDVGERTEMEGSSIENQVWAWVRATPGYEPWRRGDLDPAMRDFIGPLRISIDEERRAFMMGSEEFEAVIVATWRLPRAFFSPLPALCGKEVEELARGRREIEEQLDREERGDVEGRLVRGMTKEP